MTSSFYIFFYILFLVFVVSKIKNIRWKLFLTIALFPMITLPSSFEFNLILFPDFQEYIEFNVGKPFDFLNEIKLTIRPLFLVLFIFLSYLSSFPYSLFISLISFMYLVIILIIYRVDFFYKKIKLGGVNWYVTAILLTMIFTFIFTHLDYYEMHPFISISIISILWILIFYLSFFIRFNDADKWKRILIYSYLIFFSPNITTSKNDALLINNIENTNIKFPIIKTQIDYLYNLSIFFEKRIFNPQENYNYPDRVMEFYGYETDPTINSYGLFIFILVLILQSRHHSNKKKYEIE